MSNIMKASQRVNQLEIKAFDSKHINCQILINCLKVLLLTMKFQFQHFN